MIDAREPFVKATYTLEGDGALVFGCFDVLTSLAVGIRTAHIPNLTAVCTRLSASNPTSSSSMGASLSNQDQVLTTFSPSSTRISATVLLPLGHYKSHR